MTKTKTVGPTPEVSGDLPTPKNGPNPKKKALGLICPPYCSAQLESNFIVWCAKLGSRGISLENVSYRNIS
jgi:hypothetical protein